MRAHTGLFVSAAQDAIALTNMSLGERLARAAVSRDGGLVASELLARSLLWQGKAAESERILTAFDPAGMIEPDLVRWGIARIANLQWAKGDADSADEVLQMLQSQISQPSLRLIVDGVASALLLFQNHLDEALALSQRVLADPAASAPAVGWAVFGGALAAALMDRNAEVAVIVAHGRQVEDKLDRLLRCLIAVGEIRALVLAGDFAAAEARSADIVRIASTGQHEAWAIANVLVGTVEVGRGQLRAAVARWRTRPGHRSSGAAHFVDVDLPCTKPRAEGLCERLHQFLFKLVCLVLFHSRSFVAGCTACRGTGRRGLWPD